MTKPSEEQQQERRGVSLPEVAISRFVPFVVDLFGGNALRMSRAEHLPLREPGALTAEVVEATVEITRRGTVAFLCRRGGWRALTVARAGEEDPHRQVRVTSALVWSQRAQRLRFGPSTFDALLYAYNCVCAVPLTQGTGQVKGGRQRARAEAPDELAQEGAFALNGDLLVRHLIWWRLRHANVQVHDAAWRLFTQDPLTRLARLDTRDVSAERVLSRLLESPDMESLWPWLDVHLVQCWEQELGMRWDSLARFDRLNRALAEFSEALCELAVRHNRRDWLVVWVRFIRRHFARQGAEVEWMREFNRLSRDLKLSEREQYRRTWARWVDVALRVHREYEGARHLHPIEREAADKVLMEEVEAHPFGELAWRAHAFANQLNAVIT